MVQDLLRGLASSGCWPFAPALTSHGRRLRRGSNPAAVLPLQFCTNGLFCALPQSAPSAWPCHPHAFLPAAAIGRQPHLQCCTFPALC
jgi:hypothetical protein